MVCSVVHDVGQHGWRSAATPVLIPPPGAVSWMLMPAPCLPPTSRPCSMHQSHLHSEMARLEREMAAKEHALLSMSQHAALKQK